MEMGFWWWAVGKFHPSPTIRLIHHQGVCGQQELAKPTQMDPVRILMPRYRVYESADPGFRRLSLRNLATIPSSIGPLRPR